MGVISSSRSRQLARVPHRHPATVPRRYAAAIAQSQRWESSQEASADSLDCRLASVRRVRTLSLLSLPMSTPLTLTTMCTAWPQLPQAGQPVHLSEM